MEADVVHGVFSVAQFMDHSHGPPSCARLSRSGINVSWKGGLNHNSSFTAFVKKNAAAALRGQIRIATFTIVCSGGHVATMRVYFWTVPEEISLRLFVVTSEERFPSPKRRRSRVRGHEDAENDASGFQTTQRPTRGDCVPFGIHSHPPPAAARILHFESAQGDAHEAVESAETNLLADSADEHISLPSPLWDYNPLHLESLAWY
jgi:hypothetical protein